MGSHITRQVNPHHPASIKLKLIQKKASAMVTRHKLLSMSSYDKEGEDRAPPADTIDAHLLIPSMVLLLPRRQGSKLLLMS